MTLEFIVRSWVFNLDVEPYEIGIDEATEYLTYIDPDTLTGPSTPEMLMDIWNKVVNE